MTRHASDARARADEIIQQAREEWLQPYEEDERQYVIQLQVNRQILWSKAVDDDDPMFQVAVCKFLTDEIESAVKRFSLHPSSLVTSK